MQSWRGRPGKIKKGGIVDYYKLENCRPVQLDDLIRVGRNCDGGYVLSKKHLENTKILLSFGISDDWSFETAFLRRAKARLYAFDNSVSALIFIKNIYKYLAQALASVFTLNFVEAGKQLRNCVYSGYKALEFKFFFSNKERFFVQKFLGQVDNESFICFDTIFKKFIPHTHTHTGLPVFVKMDIEKWEYLTLPLLAPYFSRINGLVVEFHRLDITGASFRQIMEMLSAQFYIAHIHGNNFSGFIQNTGLPEVLEMTFINKQLLPEQPVLSKKQYPVKGLDFPCARKLPDLPLNFG
jgi:hypothetical protein